MNYLRITILLAALTASLIMIGSFLGGSEGFWLALAIAAILNTHSYLTADKLALTMHACKEINDVTAYPALKTVHSLAQAAGTPTPRTYISENLQPNAFAIGRNPNYAGIVLTTGLLDVLAPNEIAAVIGHELAHIRSRDTLMMTVTSTISGTVMAIGFTLALLFRLTRGRSNGTFIFILLAPLAAAILQLAISRSREYAADRAGAEICGHPEWLISALCRLTSANEVTRNDKTFRHPATALLHIVDPLPDEWWARLFATHPNVENRITRLNEMMQQRRAD